MNRLTIFVHLHKTGGMTLLNEIVSLNYSEDERVDLHGIFDLSVCADHVRNHSPSLRIVSGHFRYGLHEHLSRPCRYITMLRQPARRVHSLYHYYRNRPEQWRLHLTNRGDDPEPIGTLRSFLTDGRFRITDNGMVRALSGIGESHPYGEIGEEECEAAVQHLDHCVVAGLLEQFDASLLLMAQFLNWSTLYYARSNQNHEKPRFEEMSPEDRSLIEAHTRWDRVLYEAAAERLQQQVEAEGIRDQLSSYQFVNGTLYQPARRIYSWMRAAKYKVQEW